MKMDEDGNALTNKLKFFFEKYGKIVIPLIIALIAFLTWSYLHNNTALSTQSISDNYQQLQADLLDKTPASNARLENFADENSNTYGVMASLELAKKYVDQGEFDKAALRLEKTVENTHDRRLQAMLLLRLARIQSQQKKFDEAIKTLDNIKDNHWAAMIADARGDILSLRGDKEDAKSAWKTGIMTGASPALQEILQMKINNPG